MQQQESGKTRAWKKSVAALSKDLLAVEDKEAELTECFPQSTDPDTAWTVTVIGYHVKLVCGLLGVVVSLCWVLHIILYMLVDPPATPFLNDLFVDLDSVFSLFGTAAFAGFCFYLLSCVIKGNMKLGLNLLVFTYQIHPMKLNGTLMSSFLFNVGLICTCSVAVIQFCASAFDVYANETQIQSIFNVEIENLRGLKELYTNDIFLYCFLVVAFLTSIWLACTTYKPKRKHNRDTAYQVTT